MSLSFSAGCSIITPLKIAIEIPARPTLPPTLIRPDVRGRVMADEGGVPTAVLLPIDQATLLKQYVVDLEAYLAETQVILNGHIEKLENRLKALGGK